MVSECEIRTQSKQGLIDLVYAFTDALVGDPQIAASFLTDPKNPLYIILDGAGGAGKSLIVDAIKSRLIDPLSFGPIARKDMRPDLEITKAEILGQPIEIHFKNLKQVLKVPGPFGVRYLESPKRQIKWMAGRREHGGITCLQNPGMDDFCRKISDVRILLHRDEVPMPGRPRRIQRRDPAIIRSEDQDTWKRITRIQVSPDIMQSESFKLFWGRHSANPS